MKQEINILFIDDEWCTTKNQRLIIEATYGKLRYNNTPFIFHYETAKDELNTYSAKPVLQKLKNIPKIDAIILDINFKGKPIGLDILDEIRKKYPVLPIFILSSEDENVEVIEQAMKRGANEYFIKQPKPTIKELEETLLTYINKLDHAIWGNSASIRRIRALIARLSFSGLPILIIGESGTGKELAARTIHRQGKKFNTPFIPVNCASKDNELLDSELFGHEKGAFTGATSKKEGYIKQADGGVLFLDEIGDIPQKLQKKLLRVLADHKYQRLGGSDFFQSNFHLVCATNKSPEEMVSNGTMREDFYYRINSIYIEMPPLRKRKEDIPILTDFFFNKYKLQEGANYPALKITESVYDKLKQYEWHRGNVRELDHTIKRSVVFCKKDEITGEEIIYTDKRLDLKINDDTSKPASLKSILSEDQLNFLPEDPSQWARQRTYLILKIILEAKRKSKNTTEFMERLYPNNRQRSTQARDNLIKRLTNSPWGLPDLSNDPMLLNMINEIKTY